LRQVAPSGSPAQRDVDDVPLAELQSRPLIIRRRTPTASRPPANFRLAERTADYEVWERTGSPQVLRHVPLGGGESPLFTPSCADLEAIAREARKAGGRLAFAERPAPVVFRTSAVPSRPPGWLPDPNEPEALVTVGPGAVRGTIDVPRAARYRVWLEGTFGRQVDVLIDGRPVGRARDRANHRGQNENLGTVRLGAGRHRIAIVRAGGSPRPGSGGVGRRVGRLWLTETPDDARIGVLASAQVGSLCGRPLDWVEIVR
ncbi:MAG: hypothetical protein MUC84_09160, partial [Solirubrobacteraceae bacterium]|nr:hypothetical protein [Solirubrobacteraceae bacterium]